MTVLKKLLFVFNPHAGKGQIKENLCGIIDLFTAGGYEVVAYATQAPRAGYEKIVADGSDFGRRRYAFRSSQRTDDAS